MACLAVHWVACAPRLYEGSIKHGVNVSCTVPFQELNHFFFYYFDEAVYSYFADESAENASCVAFLVWFDEA